jgi:hypothetical protein
MPYQATLEYSESLLRSAAFAYWRRLLGSAYGLATAVVAVSLLALLQSGDRSWVVGALGSFLFMAVAFSVAVFVTYLRGSLSKFRRMGSGSASLVASEEHLSVSSKLGTTTVPWSAVAQVWRYSEFWLLVFAQRQVVTIPLAGLSLEARAFILARVQAAGGRVGA